jgi:peptidyl-prolyl cis-trans isomerase D
MLQDIRSNIQGTMAKIIIGLIVVSFSIFGIESILVGNSGSAVAEVNGEEISPYALQQEVAVQQRQLLAMLGDQADPALLEESMLREQALEALIQRSLVTQAASSMHLTVSEQALGEIIGSMEQFQIDGQFNAELFQATLAGAGFTPALFRQRLSEDLLQGQLRAGIAGSDFATTGELRNAARISAEGRDVRYLSLPMERFRDATLIDEQAVQAYYERNSERFTSEEQLVLDYIDLSIDRYREPVSEARLEEEFALVRDEFEQAEEARVSHILLEGDAQARLAEVEEALASGMDFAAAAAAFSDDIGSSGSGGDLGFTAGDTFPEAMEAAISGLAVGEQGVVETEAGTHVLLVTDRRAASAVTLDDVRAELTRRIQDAEASRALLRDVEMLRDIAFNAADLEDPARELGVTVQRSPALSRGVGEGLFSNGQLRSAAFSEDVLEAGHNSEVIELDPEHFVVLRVAERRPPELLPLADVREEIVAALADEAALAAARAEGERILAALDEGEAIDVLAAQADLDWQVELGARRDSLRLPPAVRERLFTLAMPAGGGPVLDLVAAPDVLYVLEFTRVSPGSLDKLDEAQRERLRQQLAGESGGILQQQIETALRSEADVKVY